MKNFKDTFSFIKKLDSHIEFQQMKEAGLLWQEFTTEWHYQYGDYVEIYDNPTIESVPYYILEKINAVDLLSKGGDVYGIDKIARARSGEIDVMQDKYTLLKNKNLSANKAEGMMSLRENPLENIRSFILNTPADDISHYMNIWKTHPPIIYTGEKFIPSWTDEGAVDRDKKFWKNIARKNKGLKQRPLYHFTPRSQVQVDYVKNPEKFIEKNLKKKGEATWHHIVAGGVGKSVLDPVLIGQTQLKHWNSKLSGTQVPVNVHFFHSTKTLNANGYEAIQRRRAMGIYDRVIVISGTKIVDHEDEEVNKAFFKTTDAVSTMREIRKGLKQNQSILLITLYHHSEIIAEILEQLKKKNKQARFWSRLRDECDWPCSNADSQFGYALDKRTDSVITFGSSGTDRYGDPSKDYGTNNINIHGPRLFYYPWADAENDGVVKKLILITPFLKISDLAKNFPDIVNNKGKVDLKFRVKGIRVNDEEPTAELIAKLACIIRALYDYPEVKRTLAFANFVKNNKMASENWKYVCDKILPNDANARRVKKFHWEVLNDDFISRNDRKTMVQAMKRAKNKINYIAASCKLFNRGYNDTSVNKKHHAGFHLDEKGDVDTIQGIWRIVRTDKNTDPFSYYILPLIYNDMDEDKPTWSEDLLGTLRSIFKHNHNIKDDFEIMMQKSKSGERQRNSNGKRIWLPKEFDPALLDGLVGTMATHSGGALFQGLRIEAHDWLTSEYMALTDPHTTNVGAVNKKFLEQKRFETLWSEAKFKTQKSEMEAKERYKGAQSSAWVHRFFAHGFHPSPDTKKHITQNRITWDEHREKMLEKVMEPIDKFVEKSREWWDSRPEYDYRIHPTKGYPTDGYKEWSESLFKKMKITRHYARIKDKIFSKEWIDSRVPKSVEVMIEIMEQALRDYEWRFSGGTGNPVKKKLQKKYNYKLVDSVMAHPLINMSTGGLLYKGRPLQELLPKTYMKKWDQKIRSQVLKMKQGLVEAIKYYAKTNGGIRGLDWKGNKRKIPEKGYRVELVRKVFDMGLPLPMISPNTDLSKGRIEGKGNAPDQLFVFLKKVAEKKIKIEVNPNKKQLGIIGIIDLYLAKEKDIKSKKVA